MHFQYQDMMLARTALTPATSVRPVVATILQADSEATSTPEVYLKLHLLSHRLVKPHGVSLTGIFGLLPTGLDKMREP